MPTAGPLASDQVIQRGRPLPGLGAIDAIDQSCRLPEFQRAAAPGALRPGQARGTTVASCPIPVMGGAIQRSAVVRLEIAAGSKSDGRPVTDRELREWRTSAPQ